MRDVGVVDEMLQHPVDVAEIDFIVAMLPRDAVVDARLQHVVWKEAGLITQHSDVVENDEEVVDDAVEIVDAEFVIEFEDDETEVDEAITREDEGEFEVEEVGEDRCGLEDPLKMTDGEIDCLRENGEEEEEEEKEDEQVEDPKGEGNLDMEV